MNTNKAIQDVLATRKLGLPEGLNLPRGSNAWFLNGEMLQEDQQAYDLIAMHWAREIDHGRVFCSDGEWLDAAQGAFNDAMRDGHSEAAIRAIHAALCAEEPND